MRKQRFEPHERSSAFDDKRAGRERPYSYRAHSPRPGFGFVRRRDIEDRASQSVAPRGTVGRYDRTGERGYQKGLERFKRQGSTRRGRSVDFVRDRRTLGGGGVEFGGGPAPSGSTPSYAGRGPRGYRRSDDRIRQHVCELLTAADHLDATEIEVAVSDGIVTLSGRVEDRAARRRAENLAASAAGVLDVQNRLGNKRGLVPLL